MFAGYGCGTMQEMMRSSIKTPAVFILTLAVLMIASSLKAAEWGVAGTFSAGNFNFTSKPYLLPEREASGTMKKAGAALLLDSGPLGDSLFSTRLSIGFEKASLDSDDFSGSESFYCFNTDIALGIGLVTRPSFRFWIGPDLRMGLADGSGDDFTRDALARVIGFGAVVSADIRMGDNYGLSLSAGARSERYISGSQYGATNDLNGNTAYVYFMAGFLLRIADDKDGAR